MLKRVRQSIYAIKKSMYYELTSANAEVAYYSEIYTKENRERAIEKQMQFIRNLLKIRWMCNRKQFEQLQEWLITEEKGLKSFVPRPKVYRYGEQFIGYKKLLTDVIGSLILETKTQLHRFEELEQIFGIEGFALKRAAYRNTNLSIQEIYRRLSALFGRELEYQMECEEYRQSLLINHYLEKALNIASYNNTKLIGYIASPYPANVFDDFLREHGVIFQKIDTKMSDRKEEKVALTSLLMSEKTEQKKQWIILTSDYERFQKVARRTGTKLVYYRSTQRYLKEMLEQGMVTEKEDEYQERIGLALFDGRKKFDRIYYREYMCLAPCIYELFWQIKSKAQDLSAQILFLSGSDHGIARLYDDYIGSCSSILWTPFITNPPGTMEEWEEWKKHYPELNRVPKVRMKYNCLRYESKVPCQENIKKYLFAELGACRDLLVIDLSIQEKLSSSFGENMKELFPEYRIHEYSLKDWRSRSLMGEEVDVLCADSPILVGIYEEDFAFVMPEVSEEEKAVAKRVEKVMRDYFSEVHKLVKRKTEG